MSQPPKVNFRMFCWIGSPGIVWKSHMFLAGNSFVSKNESSKCFGPSMLSFTGKTIQIWRKKHKSRAETSLCHQRHSLYHQNGGETIHWYISWFAHSYKKISYQLSTSSSFGQVFLKKKTSNLRTPKSRKKRSPKDPWSCFFSPIHGCLDFFNGILVGGFNPSEKY